MGDSYVLGLTGTRCVHQLRGFLSAEAVSKTCRGAGAAGETHNQVIFTGGNRDTSCSVKFLQVRALLPRCRSTAYTTPRDCSQQKPNRPSQSALPMALATCPDTTCFMTVYRDVLRYCHCRSASASTAAAAKHLARLPCLSRAGRLHVPARGGRQGRSRAAGRAPPARRPAAVAAAPR